MGIPNASHFWIAPHSVTWWWRHISSTFIRQPNQWNGSSSGANFLRYSQLSSVLITILAPWNSLFEGYLIYPSRDVRHEKHLLKKFWTLLVQASIQFWLLKLCGEQNLHFTKWHGMSITYWAVLIIPCHSNFVCLNSQPSYCWWHVIKEIDFLMYVALNQRVVGITLSILYTLSLSVPEIPHPAGPGACTMG